MNLYAGCGRQRRHKGGLGDLLDEAGFMSGADSVRRSQKHESRPRSIHEQIHIDYHLKQFAAWSRTRDQTETP